MNKQMFVVGLVVLVVIIVFALTQGDLNGAGLGFGSTDVITEVIIEEFSCDVECITGQDSACGLSCTSSAQTQCCPTPPTDSNTLGVKITYQKDNWRRTTWEYLKSKQTQKTYFDKKYECVKIPNAGRIGVGQNAQYGLVFDSARIYYMDELYEWLFIVEGKKRYLFRYTLVNNIETIDWTYLTTAIYTKGRIFSTTPNFLTLFDSDEHLMCSLMGSELPIQPITIELIDDTTTDDTVDDTTVDDTTTDDSVDDTTDTTTVEDTTVDTTDTSTGGVTAAEGDSSIYVLIIGGLVVAGGLGYYFMRR